MFLCVCVRVCVCVCVCVCACMCVESIKGRVNFASSPSLLASWYPDLFCRLCRGPMCSVKHCTVDRKIFPLMRVLGEAMVVVSHAIHVYIHMVNQLLPGM